MLEIIAIVVLIRIVGGMAEDKDRDGLWFKILAVVLWFVGEIVGMIVGALAIGMSDMCSLYVFAALGAVAGGVVAVAITAVVPPGAAAAV